MWKAGGTPVTPAHADWYNALGAEPPVLYWELVTRTDGAGPIPEPPFWQRLKDYDKRTGHSTEVMVPVHRLLPQYLVRTPLEPAPPTKIIHAAAAAAIVFIL